MATDFRECGGILYVRDGGDPNDPADQLWNFGVMGQPGIQGPVVGDSSIPNLYDVAPHVAGRWDGKTSICVHDAVRKVLGKDMPPQLQPKGTCGGRTAKMGGQLLQCVMIAAGKSASYKPVSHAWPYALARMDYGMLGSGDGVPDGSIPIVLQKYGYLHAEEAGDTKDYGAGSDDLAAKWGGRGGPPRDLFKLAEDNKVAANVVKVRSLTELYDGYAAGGVGMVSSARGFDGPRNAEGECPARGTWYHYMTGSGVSVVRGRARPVIDQSWGKNNPKGPLVEDGRWPDHCFAADPDIVLRDMIQRGSFHLVFSFPLWDEEEVIDWRKI